MLRGKNEQATRVCRRRRITGAVALVVVLGAVAYVVSATIAPVPPTQAVMSNSSEFSENAVPLSWPFFGRGAIGAVGFPGVLASHGPQDAVPIASIAKTITALVVLAARPLNADEQGPMIAFTDADTAIYEHERAGGGSVTPVISGTSLTEKQALQALLIPSANNYSISLVTWAFGSVEAYLTVAKTWLNENDFRGTVVADASGLSPATVSTPADLVGIGKRAIENPVIAGIVAQSTAEIPSVGTIETTNTLIGQYGVDGIKTGTTDEAGSCLLFSSDFVVGAHTITVVGAVLGGANRSELDSAMRALLDTVQHAFHEIPLTTAGDPYATYTTAWGQSAQLVTATDASAIAWQSTPATSVIQAKPVGTAKKGEQLGTITFAVGEQTVQVPLILDDPIDDPGPIWRIVHPGAIF